MNNNPNSLALRIAQILEEHTAEEVDDAIAILKRCGTTSKLLAYLAAATQTTRPRKRNNPPNASSKPKPLDQVTSKAVRDLEKRDPGKYQLLLEFDKLVRQAKVLETNDALRRFGEGISKDFRARTARKDNISALMTTLAQLSKEDLKQSIERALENSASSKSGEYQRLARFLIRGEQ